MKKIIGIILAGVFLLSGCGQSSQEGVTLTREEYDTLYEAKAERDQLLEKVDTLEKQIEILTNQASYENQETGGQESTSGQEGNGTASANTPSTPAESTPSATEAEPEVSYETTTDTFKEATVEPVNDVTEGSDFGKFLEAYRTALDERDEAYVKAHTHPNVKISFGGHSGWDGLVSYWSIDQGSEDFYKMMKTTLQYGAVDTSGGLGNAYTAPYIFAKFPDGYGEGFAVVTGSNVNIRTQATTDSDVITKATYEVVKIVEEEKNGWVKIQLSDGAIGYIYSTYIWDPLYYRAGFTKVDGTWLLEFFVKGD